MRIELRGVRKRFGHAEALRGLDLTLPAGTRAALIGPNGSGKSTLIRSLLGLLACEGEVRLDGRSPFADRLQTARRLAYVPQIAPQLSATVDEVIRTVALTRDLDPARIDVLARRLDLDVSAIRTRPFRNLSGGMKQKLLIAAAFAADASLLVLDEPTASLDARARERFFELCAEIPSETTVLLCSHRLEELHQLAGHVVALEEGLVTYDGPSREFLATPGRKVLELICA
jgi:ABC-2 type transport system ATP-binding protein